MDYFAVTRWDHPLSESAFVVPRDKELEEIHQALFSRIAHTVSIGGAYGSGKTFLAKQYAEKYKEQYCGGIHYFETPISAQKFLEQLEHRPELSSRFLTLYIIDEIQYATYDSNDSLKFLNRYRNIRDKPGSHIILIGQHVSEMLLRNGLRVEVPPIAESELSAIMKEHMYKAKEGLPKSTWENLVYRSNGNMRELIGLLHLLQEQGGTNFIHHQGLIDANGNPLLRHNHIEVDVATINKRLINDISIDPELLYRLTPREFEFLVADLFARDGYEVLVTPATRDGGKDIYAARKDNYGSLLYIVECKRNDRSRRVGVHVVRNLYGILMQEKATYSMVATTSYFTNPALEFQRSIQNHMSLYDYDKLIKWIRGKN
jgi:Predicted endonuclease distantly related to archaeal Holliday junction resolvase and Mrr-like restriction enzymes